MNVHNLIGGCGCGNVTVNIEVTNNPLSYRPRTCDCEFCRKYQASYISDHDGSLAITIKKEANVAWCKQGSGIADFLVCKECEVLIGVLYIEDGQIYGALNSNAVFDKEVFGEDIVVSPKELSDSERIKRWKSIWFQNIQLKSVNA